MQKTVDFCEDFLSINANGLGRRSQTKFGISNDMNRNFIKSREWESRCIIKLYPRSHLRGNQKLVEKGGKFSPQPKMKVKSLKLEGNCCWKIRAHRITKWVQLLHIWSENLVPNTTTASKYIPKRSRICINWDQPFQTSLHQI